jgi:hypothetical protein
VTRLFKVFLAIVVAGVASIVVLAIALPSGLSYYDSATSKAFLRVAAQELPPRASIGEMDEFMRRHTTRYAFDDRHHHDYSGFLPQTKLDRILFDRKVQVVLIVSENQTFQNAEVRVYYTGL